MSGTTQDDKMAEMAERILSPLETAKSAMSDWAMVDATPSDGGEKEQEDTDIKTHTYDCESL